MLLPGEMRREYPADDMGMVHQPYRHVALLAMLCGIEMTDTVEQFLIRPGLIAEKSA